MTDYSKYKSPAVAELICRCAYLAGVFITDNLLKTLRLYHAHGIERDPYNFSKAYPCLYFFLSEGDQKEFRSMHYSLLQLQLLFAEELKELFDHNSDSQILSNTGIHQGSIAAEILHSLRTVYNSLK